MGLYSLPGPLNGAAVAICDVTLRVATQKPWALHLAAKAHMVRGVLEPHSPIIQTHKGREGAGFAPKVPLGQGGCHLACSFGRVRVELV